jgi:hypothetical protein
MQLVAVAVLVVAVLAHILENLKAELVAEAH